MRKQGRELRRHERKWGILLALPGILGYFLWVLGPTVVAVFMSFTDWSLASSPNWIGQQNYANLFNDFIFKKSLFVTFYYAIGSVVATLVVSFFWALMLNVELPGRSLFRTFFFIPSITPAVAVAMVWLTLYHPQFGLLNHILKSIGLPALQWIYDEKQVIPAFIVMSTWTIGYTITIFLAGLQGIPEYLYEAAMLDGATWWHKLRHVTIPMITPTIFFNLLMGIIGALQGGFTQAYIMTSGGPNYASMFYTYYIFLTAFQYGKMGYACALSVIMFIITIFLTVLVFRTSRYWVHYEAM
ncbi:MAG: sugar ABC transporter permease [Atribacterales bacterium]